MTVWLFKDGEPPPVGPDPRRMRMAMLASALASLGDEVHWVASTFVHVGKRLFSSADVVLSVEPGCHLHLLHAGAFSDNLSLGRYLFHRRYARRVRTYCPTLPRPDVIVSAFPLIDVAAWAVAYGGAQGIPVIVDVRDLWPDTIVDVFPGPAKPLARLALDRDFRRTRYAFSNATSLTSMSRGVLDWALAKVPREQAGSDRVFPIGFPARNGSVRPPDPSLDEWLSSLRGRRLFVYVGTLARTYNLDVVLGAARLLAPHGSTPHFVIIGDGPGLERIQRQAADLPNVSAPGWLEQAAIRRVMAAACAGLLPWNGVQDAMPNKFFEYISAGVPVLSSARGELNELIDREHVGLTFSSDDPQSLARAVVTLSADAVLAGDMARRAASLFHARFREDLVYRAFADYVHEIARAS
jgi:glycosyltransferase involved in cell wall biosynthesis